MRSAWYKPRWLFQFILRMHRALYPVSFSLIKSLENPDRDRFSFLLHGDNTKLKRAVQFQAAQPEPCMILYGSEAGILQLYSRRGEAFGDLNIRGIMPWENIDRDILEFYKKVIRQRISPGK